MAKKQKRALPERTLTKRELSKWQRQMKIRRIVIIAAVVFLVGISTWVGYEYYTDYQAKYAAWREVVIKVNDARFNMEYFVDVLDVYTAGVNTTVLYYYGDYFAGMAADAITRDESLRQAAKQKLGIEVTDAEISAELTKRQLPDQKVFRDLIRAALLEEKVKEHFGPGANVTMDQAHAQVILVESREIADEAIAAIRAGANFTVLVQEFSCNSSVQGDLGMLPRELMPNDLIADVAFNLTAAEISEPIYDAAAVKEVGYWLIGVTAAQNETIDALVMLLGSEAEAQRVKAELAAGGNFSALAANYSQHESKVKGGKIDGLKRGAMNSTAFDKVAFNLTPNTVSDPVKDIWAQTTGGYWIVQVIDRNTGALEEQVRERLRDKRVNDWLEQWQKSGTIENRLDEDRIAWAIDEVLKRRQLTG